MAVCPREIFFSLLHLSLYSTDGNKLLIEYQNISLGLICKHRNKHTHCPQSSSIIRLLFSVAHSHFYLCRYNPISRVSSQDLSREYESSVLTYNIHPAFVRCGRERGRFGGYFAAVQAARFQAHAAKDYLRAI